MTFFSIECDDALRFDLNTLVVINITEFKEYHGVNVSIMGYLDRTKVPVSIDIGFGDVFEAFVSLGLANVDIRISMIFMFWLTDIILMVWN